MKPMEAIRGGVGEADANKFDANTFCVVEKVHAKDSLRVKRTSTR